MLSKFLWIGLVVGLIACNNDGKVSQDDAERAADWTARITTEMVLDTADDGTMHLRVVDQDADASLNAFVDQLYDMAFSGEAVVYAPGVLGTPDLNRQLDPKKLYELLEQYDSVTVEDLYTGNLVDTLVDVSYTKDQVTAVNLMFSWQPTEASLFLAQPVWVAFGSQVFDRATGDFRGVRNEFYIHADPSSTSKQFDQLAIRSDSLANFRIHSLGIHPSATDQGLIDRILRNNPNQKRFTMSFLLSLDLRRGTVYMDDLLIDLPAASS